VSPTAAMVTEPPAEPPAAPAAGAVALPAAGQAPSTSKAAVPAIAQTALTLFRMLINLTGPRVPAAATRCGRMAGAAETRKV